jgi:hypothetical protein
VTDDAGGPTRPAPRRTARAVFWHVLGRLVFGALCLVCIVFSLGALLVAYQDLTGPHCDGHRMGPADTCSVLNASLYRGVGTIEQVNPPGTEPAVLTPPANWHAAPKKIHQQVLSPAGTRAFHRTAGYEMLGGAALLALLPASWAYRAARHRWSSTTTTADEPPSRT